MSPDKSAIAEKICAVLKKLGVSEELVSLVEKDIMGEESEEVETESEDTLDMGVPAKKSTVVVVKKNDSGRQSMTDMLKGF